MTQGYLKYTRAELSKIGGIGDFHAELPPLPVPLWLAQQYDTPDALADGWVVTWEEEE
jgi:hypothetical protein